jgi:hypothetical protein
MLPRGRSPVRIRDRIREAIGPALLEHGFRGRSSTFSREVGDVFHLLQLQSSTSDPGEGARFTINVAVWVPALASEAKPSVADAHWNRRLGDLGPERADLWWRADNFAMADEAARDMVERIEAYAIPALDQLKSSRELLKLWKAGHSPGITGVQADRFRRRLENPGRGA